MIGEYIKRSGDIFTQIQREREQLKTIEVTRKIQAELLGRMFIEDKIITATQLGIITKELEAPTYDYKCDNSMWQLYNHTTFALKETHPTLWMKQHIDTHKFFMENNKITLPSSTTIIDHISDPSQLELFVV